jgi:hypothetical protein
MKKLILALSLTAGSQCFSQTLHDDINTTYNFSPGKLSKAEQDEKIPLMDNFWKKVKSDTSKYLVELRTELQIEGNPKFFYFEGGQLLLSLSRADKDKQTVLDAIAKSDLSDVDRRTFVSTLNYLARAKLNTTDAALRILDDKEFRFFIPEHAIYFSQSYCLTYSLLPTNTDYFIDTITRRFRDEKDIPSQKAIVTMLWFTNSCQGNAFLKDLTSDKSADIAVVKYVNDLLSREFNKRKEFRKFDKMTFDQLVKAQIAATSRMSDEAIFELDYITKLVRKNSCRQQ